MCDRSNATINFPVKRLSGARNSFTGERLGNGVSRVVKRLILSKYNVLISRKRQKMFKFINLQWEKVESLFVKQVPRYIKKKNLKEEELAIVQSRQYNCHSEENVLS